MELKKSDYHIVKHLKFYKVLSILAIIINLVNIPYGIYFSHFYVISVREVRLNNALVGASIVVLGMGYLMYCFLNTIERLKKKYMD